MSKLIPFSLMPGAWGLKGKVRDEAKAYYDLTGEALDRRLNEINGRTSPKDALDIDLKYGRVTEYEYDTKIAEIETGVKRDIAILAVEYKHHKISENDYEMGVATAEERPWIKVVNDGFEADGDHPSFRMEFQWNIFFIEYLTINGYSGASEEEIVEKWFQELCRATVAEQIAEEGDERPFNFNDRYV